MTTAPLPEFITREQVIEAMRVLGIDATAVTLAAISHRDVCVTIPVLDELAGPTITRGNSILTTDVTIPIRDDA